MAFRGQLAKAYGKGAKLFTGTFLITGTGTVTVPSGFDTSIVNVVATVTTSGTAFATGTSTSTSTGTAGNVDSASIFGVSGLTAKIIVVNQMTTGNAQENNAQNVDVFAVVQ